MKKIIILFMFISINCFSETIYHPGIGGFVEYDRDFKSVGCLYNESIDAPISDYKNFHTSYTNINLHYVLQFWNIQVIPFTEIKTYILSPEFNVLESRPFCNIYTIGAELKWQGLSFTLDHYCAHPSISEPLLWDVKDYRMGSNVNEFKIKYSWN